MEDARSEGERDVRDFRFFTENAYYSRPDDEVDIHRLDVNDLVGAKGEPLEPNDDDLSEWRRAGQNPQYEPAALIITEVQNLYGFAEGDFDGEARRDFEYGAAYILGELASRLAPLAADSFKDAVNQLMEPVRSVAVNCLLLRIKHETVARHLGTSVETIDFLVEVALSHLEPLVEFRSPRPRPRSRVYLPEHPEPEFDPE